MSAVETGIKTFLIADVRGYTRFTQEWGDEAGARLATRFAELARKSIEATGGTLVELRGDEALGVFDSARQALRAAAELQERFVAETVADPTLPLAVGIGLDAGEAVAVDGGYRGGALNLAARLCSLAGPGAVLVSPGVAHLARKVDGLDYVERGAVRLKGLEKPVEVVAVRPEREDVARDLAFRRALDPATAGSSETRNPYKGLRAFAEDDAEDFFGREALTEHLVGRLAQTRFLAVVGPSGSGKSSVVRAGLIPRLRQGALPGSERWHVAEMFPGAYPLEELEAALLRTADSVSAGLLEQLEQDERGLLRAVKRLLADDESELVLVVDQLEELFTLVEDEARRTRFLALLERAAGDPHARLRIVVTLRADFYDRPLLYSGFAELLRDYVEALVPLKADEFERAITGPAERVGARFEPGLLAELVADVADEPGALPLLQYALTELYERREGSTLTQDAYRAIGGVSGALAGRAEEIYAGLPDAAQEAARQLFLRLVTLGEGTEDTRRRVERTELASMEVDQAALEDAIQEFGAWRLLSFDRDPRTGTPTIEVAHEALMREWGRFRRWIDNGREQVRLHRRLAAAARQWEEAGREQSYLLRGTNLAQFQLLVGESTIALTELEREFVGASRTANELELASQRRQNRRLKALLTGAVVLLVLAIAAGVLALVSRSKAQQEAKVGLGRQLGAEAVSAPRIDLAMLLARESLDLDRSPQTEGTLLATLLRSPAAVATFTVPITVRPCCALSVSPDGSVLGIPDNGDNLRLVDAHTKKTKHLFTNAGFLSPPTFTADGSTLAFFADGKKPGVDVADARTLSIRRHLPFDRRWLTKPTLNPNLALFSTPDGRTLLYLYQLAPPAGNGAYVDRWDVASGKRTDAAVGADGAVGGALVDHGRELAVVGNSAVTFLDTRTLRLRRRVSVSPPGGSSVVVGSTTISPDGRTLVVGSQNGSISFIDLQTGHSALGQGGHSAQVVTVAYSPSGNRLVSTAEDGSVIVWDPRTRTPIERLYGHAGRVIGVAFSSDGRKLFTSALDGAIFEWDLGTSRRFGRPFSTPLQTPAAAEQTVNPTPPLAISRDGTRFAVRTGPAKVGIFSTRGLSLVASFRPGVGLIEDLAWSPKGTMAATGNSGRVSLWDLRGKPRRLRSLLGLSPVPHQPEAVETAAFSPDGRLLAAGDFEGPGIAPGTIAVWDTATGKRLWKLRTKAGAVHSVAFSPDGAMLAAGREDGTVTFYDSQTGAPGKTLHLEGDSPAQSLAFTPDGTLASGDWNGIINLWNPRTGQSIGHPTLVAAAPVASVAFEPSGGTFATAGGSDGLAKLWTTSTVQQLGSAFPGDPGQWGNAQYTPDGSHLIVVYQDGKGFVWPTSLGAWEQQACEVAGRNFTHEEWRRFVGSRSYSTVCPQFPVPSG